MSRPSGQKERSRPWPADVEDLFEPSAADQSSLISATPEQRPLHPVPLNARAAPSNIPERLTPPPKSRPLRKTGRTAWMWGMAGFACGIVFWHLIGFWGFVSSVLLPPIPTNKSDAGALQKAAAAQSNSALPLRAARPRLAKTGHAIDAVVVPREGELGPATGVLPIISASE